MQNQYHPIRYWLFGIGALAALLGGFALYELGMMRAGFSRLGSLAEYRELQDEYETAVEEQKRLRERNAVLETAAKIDREAYRQVEERLIELQTQIQEQTEELEFYKGIVNADEGSGLRIQDFRISRATGERNYKLRVVLAQALRSNRKISGRLELTIEGSRGGAAETLDVRDLIAADQGAGALDFGFRYFQDLQANVTIPADFEPSRVHVRARLQGQSSKTVEEFFDWNVKPG
jgi:hypothetical protein